MVATIIIATVISIVFQIAFDDLQAVILVLALGWIYNGFEGMLYGIIGMSIALLIKIVILSRFL